MAPKRKHDDEEPPYVEEEPEEPMVIPVPDDLDYFSIQPEDL